MTILQALKGHYDRVAEREPGSIPPFGYSWEQVSFVAILSRDGELLDIDDLRVMEGKKLRPTLEQVPLVERTSDKKSKFLWDNTSYVFGRSAKSKRSDDEHKTFKDFHSTLLASTEDIGLLALLKFLSKWQVNVFEKLRNFDELIDNNVVFRLEDDAFYRFIHRRPAAIEIWRKYRETQFKSRGLCLITGDAGPIAELHQPSIGGVLGAQTSGAYIVSFNANAYESYGLASGKNAPVSEIASFAYATGLNELLSRIRGRDPKGRPLYSNRIQLADATTVFWAEAENAAEAEAAEEIFGGFLDPPSDADQTKKLRDIVQRIERGQPLAHIDPKLDEATNFYILGLSPNAARLSVRFWHRTTLGDLGHRFHQHWRDLKIDGLRWTQPPAIWLLLTRMAPARRNEQGQIKYDAKHIPPNLAGEVMRAILTGAPYPRTLLANLLMRLRTDRVVDGLRVALIKACLVRAPRRHDADPTKEVYVSLNRDDLNPAYRLGRFFAVLEKSQEAALEGINATIRDRFYGSASATPAAVFPILIRNGMHHLAGLRKGRGARWVKKPAATGAWLASEMGDILNGLSRDWPKSFTMEDQGRFAIGYFHQKFAKREDAPDDVKTDAPTDEIASDNE